MFLLAILYDVLVEIESVVESDDGDNVTRTKNFSNDLANTAFMTSVPQYDPFTGIFSD